MSKIAKISALVRAFIIFVAVLHLGSLVLAMIAGGGPFHEVNMQNGFASFVANMQFTGTWGDYAQALDAQGFNSVLILGLADAVPYALIYWQLHKMFGLYLAGQIFTLNSINHIRNLGRILMLFVLIQVFYPLVVTLVLRLGGWSESLAIHIGIGSSELHYLLTGLVVYVIAWVMREAVALKQEQELVI